jgi:hypothetical protein
VGADESMVASSLGGTRNGRPCPDVGIEDRQLIIL